jgi:threonine dehydrogenase-like Zn-dependent dehydrogenase
MLAARLHEDAHELVVDEIDAPLAAAGEAIVSVRACGICASDLHALAGHIPVGPKPLTLGHEFSGVVESGERVFVNPLLACGRCEPCAAGRPQICVDRVVVGLHRDGAFAEQVTVPEAALVPLPDEVSFEEAAIVEPASTAFHALTSRARVRPGDRVAVFGGGGIGIFGVQVARLCGAAVVVLVDVSEAALERGLANGATHVVNPSEGDPVRAVRAATGGGADVALECVGLPQTCEQAVRSLRRGGVAAFAGVGADPVVLPSTAVLAALEVEIRAVFGYSPDDVIRVLRLIAAGRLDARAAISEVVSLVDAPAAVGRFQRKTGNPVRILVSPDLSLLRESN